MLANVPEIYFTVENANRFLYRNFLSNTFCNLFFASISSPLIAPLIPPASVLTNSPLSVISSSSLACSSIYVPPPKSALIPTTPQSISYVRNSWREFPPTVSPRSKKNVTVGFAIHEMLTCAIYRLISSFDGDVTRL